MIRVAIQGVAGSYSEEAVLKVFGGRASIVECDDFEATFSAIRTGVADQAMIPIENKIIGVIESTAALIGSNDLKIHERLHLRVQHVLAGTREAQLDDIVSVRSHVEALRQCRTYLARHPHLRQEIGADTASSVRQVILDGDRKCAAICSERAAELYGAKILCKNIADDRDNWTIFCLIGN